MLRQHCPRRFRILAISDSDIVMSHTPAQDGNLTDNVSFSMPKRWLRAKETAEYLGVSIPYLARLRELKKGPPYRKFGTVVLYDIRELDAYVETLPHFETKGGGL